VSDWPNSLEPEALVGLPGTFVKTLSPHSEADPAALLWHFLIASGCLIGSDAGFQVGGDFHPPRLYGLVVGNTSKSRKGSAASRVRQVFELAYPGWWPDHVREGLSSGEGVVYHVRDEVRIRRRAKRTEALRADADGFIEVVDDPGVSDKRVMMLEEEFAQPLKVIAREGNTLSPTLRALWNHGTHGGLTRNAPIRTTNAHITIVAHITELELRRLMTETEQANGFGNRFLLCCAKRGRVLPFGGDLGDDGLRLLAERVRESITYARSFDGRLSMSADAERLWRDVYEELSEGASGMFGAMTARAEAQTLRLAVLYSLLDSSTRLIEAAHVRAALAIWRYAEDSAAYIFGDRVGNALADRIRALMIAAGEGGITRGELRRSVSHKTKTGEFDAALSHLERRFLARRTVEPTGGRDRERWFGVGGSKSPQGDETQDDPPNEAFIPSRKSELSQEGW
jgi:hypothetical protein